MNTDDAVRRAIDDEHLKLLSIFYYVLGAVNAFWAMFPLIYVVFGFILAVAIPCIPVKPGEVPPPAFVGWLIMFFGLVASAVIAVFAALKIYVGYCIARRSHRTLCYVVAALCCLSIPFGTLLGVFTFIVLSRPTVAAQFDQTTAEVVQ
jgi:hypothetical protein